MQSYSYTARDETGKIVKGTMLAESDIDLAKKISGLGYYLTRSQVEKKGEIIKGGQGQVKQKDLITFTMNLSTLLNAGVPLLAALHDLSKDATDKKMQPLLTDLRHRVEAGAAFADSLAIHKKIFSSLYVSTVRSGEATGKLDIVLIDLAAYMEWQEDLRKKIKEASTYPIILGVAMLGLLLLLALRVVPVFEKVFKEINIELPFVTRILIDSSRIFRQYWLALLFLIVGIIVALKIFGNTKNGRYVLDRLKLKVPIVGDLAHKIVLSRFAHTMSMGIKSGVNVIKCLEIAESVAGNAYMAKAIAMARENINLGQKIAEALQQSSVFPPLVLRMVSVGEQAGALGETLDKVNAFYDKEVPETIRAIFAIIEPMMIVFMGVMVGLIALSIFLPLLKIVQGVGG